MVRAGSDALKAGAYMHAPRPKHGRGAAKTQQAGAYFFLAAFLAALFSTASFISSSCTLAGT